MLLKLNNRVRTLGGNGSVTDVTGIIEDGTNPNFIPNVQAVKNYVTGGGGDTGTYRQTSVSLTAGSPYTFSHNLGNRLVQVQTFDNNFRQIELDVSLDSSTQATITSTISQTINFIVVG